MFMVHFLLFKNFLRVVESKQLEILLHILSQYSTVYIKRCDSDDTAEYDLRHGLDKKCCYLYVKTG